MAQPVMVLSPERAASLVSLALSRETLPSLSAPERRSLILMTSSPSALQPLLHPDANIPASPLFLPSLPLSEAVEVLMRSPDAYPDFIVDALVRTDFDALLLGYLFHQHSFFISRSVYHHVLLSAGPSSAAFASAAILLHANDMATLASAQQAAAALAADEFEVFRVLAADAAGQTLSLEEFLGLVESARLL